MTEPWIDVSDLSFNNLLLFETAQITWFPGWLPEKELALALKANPVVEWYMRHKCPQVNGWLDGLMQLAPREGLEPAAVRAAELCVLEGLDDLLVYAIDPGIYDRQPFLGWDTQELTSIAEFDGKVVLDIGAGTGRLALVAAETAQVVYAVEPVGNLREYLRAKAARLGIHNLYPVDGLITQIPFPDRFAAITMGGHVYGDHPQEELRELERVTQPGGLVILCPGSPDRETPAHQTLVEHGYTWSRFLEPRDGWKRKYWKVMAK